MNIPTLTFIPVTASEIEVEYYHLSPAHAPMLDPQPPEAKGGPFGYVSDFNRRVFSVSIAVRWKGMEAHGIVRDIELKNRYPGDNPYHDFQSPEDVIPGMEFLQTSVYWPELIESALWFLNTNLRGHFETIRERIAVEFPPVVTTVTMDVTEAKAAFIAAHGDTPGAAADYDTLFHGHDDPSPSEA